MIAEVVDLCSVPQFDDVKLGTFGAATSERTFGRRPMVRGL